MANDFPQTWMIHGDWICGRHCWDASVTTPTSFALLSMWCNLHLASQFRILQGGPFFYSNCRKSFSKIIDIVRTKIDIDTTFWWLLYVFILIFFNSNGKFGRTGYGFLLGLPHKPQGCHIGLIQAPSQPDRKSTSVFGHQNPICLAYFAHHYIHLHPFIFVVVSVVISKQFLSHFSCDPYYKSLGGCK